MNLSDRRYLRAKKASEFFLSKIRHTSETLKQVYDSEYWFLFGISYLEIMAIHDTLKDKNIESVAEVGRYYGGSAYLFSCIFPQLKHILSIDKRKYECTDPLKDYFTHYNIENQIITLDSNTYIPNKVFDLVLIDSAHTIKEVVKDIEIWKNNFKYICFHDYTDEIGRIGKKYLYDGLVPVIDNVAKKYGWKQIGKRARSEIVFETK